MVKECPVLINNEVVTVADYDGVQVQFASIHKQADTIFVNFENDKYTIVDENYKPKKKKTTKIENVKDAAENENA